MFHHPAMLKKLIWMSFVCLVASAMLAQQPAASSASSKPAAATTAEDPADQVDLSALAKETEQIDQRTGKMGMFWWTPIEFWEQSAIKQGVSPGQARRQFQAMRDYNVFIIGIGDMGGMGIDWQPAEVIHKSVSLRDQAGNVYRPLESVSSDVEMFVGILKPILKGMLGPMGEGIQIVFFPVKDKTGKIFADPFRASEFSLLVADVMGPKVATYTWRLPVSALLPAKYCPVGKERVEANWKYCPWHGNKLDADATPAAPPTPAAAPK
jgi:hypothetical protein